MLCEVHMMYELDQNPLFIVVPFPPGRNCKAPREAKAKAVAPKRKAAEEPAVTAPSKRRRRKRGGASSAPSTVAPPKKVNKTKK